MAARFVVTGAAGFVGGALARRLPGPAHALRLSPPDWRERIAATDLAGAVVFHLAARVHSASRDDEAFTRDNVTKTSELARAAARAGAERLVFLSTVKVHGEETRERPFRVGDQPHPQDAYARSKWTAECTLARIATETGLAVSVVRAPLVYGAHPKGNLAALLRLCDSPWPLPFGSLANRRSFVHRDDLARLLIACAQDAKAAGKTYLAAHDESVSTSRLVASLRTALGRPARLFAWPAWALEAGAGLIARRETALRLTRSLEVDASEAVRDLGWKPTVGLEAAVHDMAAGMREVGAP